MIGTLEQLYDYEQVEDAWIAILVKCGLTCYPEFSDNDKDASKVPYVEVTLNDVAPDGKEYPFKGEILPCSWKANLVARVVTFRGVNSDKQRLITGRIRIEIQRFRQNFTPAILPFHRVDYMRETSLTRGVDEMNDFTELTASIVFTIRDDVWPEGQ